MGFVILFLQTSFLYFLVSLLMISLVWAIAKKPSSSYFSSTSLIKQHDFPSTVLLDTGVLSLNLMRLGKMKTYKISVLMFLDSKETKAEVALQQSFFKELVANMLFNFSIKELKHKTIFKKEDLKDINIFINKGSLHALKIKMISG